MGAEQTWFHCCFPLGRIDRVMVVSTAGDHVEVKRGKTTYRDNRKSQLGEYHPTYDGAADAWLGYLAREVADARGYLKASEGKLERAKAWIEDHRTEVGL